MSEKRKLSEFRPQRRNPNRHNQRGLGMLDNAMAQDGYVAPMTATVDGEIIDGSARLERVGERFKDADPIIVPHDGTRPIIAVRTDIPNADAPIAKRISLRANRIAQVDLDWDVDILKDLKTEIDLSDLWNEQEFNELIASSFKPQVEEDEIPPVPEKPVSQLGDLYELDGKHRVLCADSTIKENVETLMNGEKAVLMSTDPPYGVDYGDIANSRLRAVDKTKGRLANNYSKQPYPDIENDDLDGEKLQEFLEAAIRAAVPILIENPAFYLWHPMLTQGTFFAAAAADILIHRQIIWVKPSLIMGRGDYHWRHELCFYGWIRGKRCAWYGGRDQDTVWEVGRENDGIHPTQKPLELFAIPIRNHTKLNEICYDPFLGSGTQLIAAEQLNRRCFGIDIEPRYIDVTVSRYIALRPDAVIIRNGERLNWKALVEERDRQSATA